MLYNYTNSTLSPTSMPTATFKNTTQSTRVQEGFSTATYLYLASIALSCCTLIVFMHGCYLRRQRNALRMDDLEQPWEPIEIMHVNIAHKDKNRPTVV